MKKVFLSICCMSLLAISLISVSCNKDKDDDNGGGNGGGGGGGGGSFVVTAKDVIGGSSEIVSVTAFVFGDDDEYEIASAQYKSNGFQLTLPSTVPDKSLSYAYEFDCIEELMNDTKAKMTGVWIVAFDSDGDEIGEFWLADFAAEVEAMYIYADRNFTVKGYDCDDWKWDCDFKKGWNTMYGDYSNELITTKKPTGSNLQWYFEDYYDCDKTPSMSPKQKTNLKKSRLTK